VVAEPLVGQRLGSGGGSGARSGLGPGSIKGEVEIIRYELQQPCSIRLPLRGRKLVLGATGRRMTRVAMENVVLRHCVIAALAVALSPAAGAVDAADEVQTRSDLDRLIEQFNAGARQTNGSIQLDAWIEGGREGHALVVVVEPRGEFKLVADPGITVTPTEQPGVEWLVPLPYRHVDPEIQYFTPPASVRLPFRTGHEQPLEILVEYAYCVVEYQCFFGEEVLTVARRDD
jgi:hypothetical protein